MSQVDADRNLLFGVLALQVELIDDRQFVDACAGWAAHKDRPLADLLVERGWLSAEDRKQVELLLGRKLKKHGGDVRATLGAIAGADARDAIRSIDDSDIRKSLSSLPPAAGYVFAETLAPNQLQNRSRYTLTRLHAEGGLGKVWVARDRDLNREVALKEIQADKASHPEMWRRFLKEAQVTGQLEHPNIVPVYELGRREEDDQPFYTMRFVRGRTLREAIAEYYKHRSEGKVDPLERPKLLQAFVSICQAIAYAHSRGVIHRDLKPENVVLGGFGEVIVLDWGLAKMVDRPDEPDDLPDVALTDDARAEVTRAGRQLGTPAYMAPEQAEGRLDLIDARTDIYGLGTILFEVLSGRAPHDGKNSVEILNRIVSGETPRARSGDLSVPPGLDAICAKAMAKGRADRYSKASELTDEVQRWLADEPVRAHPEGWARRVARWARHHRGTVRAAAAALAMTLVISLFYADSLRKAQKETTEALRIVAKERDHANQEARTALQFWSDLSLERGVSLMVQGDSRGLLWMAHALETNPSDDAIRDFTIRTNLADWSRSIQRLIGIFPLSTLGRQSMAFSPDGRTVLIGGAGEVRLFDVADGSQLGKTMMHQGSVDAVAFSPDAKTVLTGSSDGTARLWNATDGSQLGRTMTHANVVRAVAFSPDGKTVLTGSAEGTARLWNATDGSQLGRTMMHQGAVVAVAFSPDGKTVITGSSDSTARLWTVADGSQLGRAMTHRGYVKDVAFSPDGLTVLTGSLDNYAQLWNATDGSNLRRTMMHDGGVNAVAFSPDGKTVLTGSADNTARLWNAATGWKLGRTMMHQGAVVAVAFSPDGETALTGSADTTARLWNAADGSPLGVMTGQNAVKSVAFSPDGKTVLTGADPRSTRLWDATEGSPRGKTMMHQYGFQVMAFSPDGKTVLGAGFDVARLLNAADGSQLGTTMKHDGWVTAVAFSPDGKTVLTGSYDRTARLWNVNDGSPRGRTMTHQSIVTALAFSRDGKTVLTECIGGTARLWSAADGSQLGRTMTLKGWVNAVTFSPDGKTVLTGSNDNSARLWSAADGSQLGRTMIHEGWVNAVTFSPDGQTVLTGSSDGTARLWNIADGSQLGRAMTHQSSVNAIAFSPDGQTVLTGSSDSTARLWNVADGSQLGRAMTHQSSVDAVAFSPDGKSILTGGTSFVRLWNAPRAIVGDPKVLDLWTQVITGVELVGDGVDMRSLHKDEWDNRRRQLLGLEGPPGLSPKEPSILKWHKTKAEENRQAGRWFAAEWHLTRLIALRSGEGSLYAERGRARLELGRKQESLADFDRAIALQPREGSTYVERGLALLQLGRREKAQADFVHAVKLGSRLSADPRLPGYMTTERKRANLLKDASFEKSEAPAWTRKSWRGDPKTTSTTRERAFEGQQSAILRAAADDDVWLSQTAAIKHDATYLLSGWARAENVSVVERGGSVGANLSLIGSFERSASLVGAQDWTYLTLVFSANGRTQVEVAARLGQNGSTATGTAWFDDLCLIEIVGKPALPADSP